MDGKIKTKVFYRVLPFVGFGPKIAIYDENELRIPKYIVESHFTSNLIEDNRVEFISEPDKIISKHLNIPIEELEIVENPELERLFEQNAIIPFKNKALNKLFKQHKVEFMYYSAHEPNLVSRIFGFDSFMHRLSGKIFKKDKEVYSIRTIEKRCTESTLANAVEQIEFEVSRMHHST